MKVQVVNEVNKVITIPLWSHPLSLLSVTIYILCFPAIRYDYSSYIWIFSCDMKDFVIEALRSIAELITYGDQHDVAYFEYVFAKDLPFWWIPFILARSRPIKFSVTWYLSLQVCRYFCRFFMEKQVMGELVRILRISRTVIVSLQLLQTMSIVIQNLKNEHSICK